MLIPYWGFVLKVYYRNILFDGFVKSYIMPLRSTVTENNLSIISRGYDLVIWKLSLRWKPESRNSVTNWKKWIPAFVGMAKKWCFSTFYEFILFDLQDYYNKVLFMT